MHLGSFWSQNWYLIGSSLTASANITLLYLSKCKIASELGCAPVQNSHYIIEMYEVVTYYCLEQKC